MPSGIKRASTIAIAATTVANLASAQDLSATYSLYGTPGLLEMPTAQTAPESELIATFSYVDTLPRTSLTFQVTKRLSGTFRFTAAEVFNELTGVGTFRDYNRGFDLQYRFNNETDYLPAFAIGLRDVLTPGRFQSEYLVASKSVGDNVIVTAGLGWGALGTRDGFDNPLGGDFATRPAFDPADPEGQLATDQWFKGDAALFGGLEYQINDTWGVKAEYSSNNYPQGPGNIAVDVDSPLNYGLTYRGDGGYQLGLSYMYGNQIGVSGSFALNANDRAGGSGLDPAPPPVKPRSPDLLAAQSWDRKALPERAVRSALSGLLKLEGVTLRELEMTDTSARIRYSNNRYRAEAQAAGRIARMMTQIMPAPIEVFILEPVRRGIPISAITIRRTDIEQFENRVGGTDALFEQSTFGDAGGPDGLTPVDRDTNPFAWGLGPYFRFNPFGGNGTVNVDTGLSLQGRYQIQPNLVAYGAIEQSIVPPDDDSTGIDPTPDIQNVRSDASSYGNDGVPVLSRLTLARYGRPGTDLYSRITVGYLERFFGGVSAELLWKPVDSRLGLGIEINEVAQRDTDMKFGFDEYDYQVTTGHVSAYYDIGNGYHTQVDLGRYLAGDWGGTLSVDREFDNGWVIGAYVSQTDMDYADFGDGSYNKGISVSIPTDFFTGTPSRGSYRNSFRTRTGDGGARLSVDGRLYDVVRGGHKADLADGWGRFWR
ncbi:YjbH domain-containing protein [Yoonia sediminilitoris]|uniref:Exopolysaccharide biosynthesis protein YbjH n=1 Tax=Yoonia sediminilitoris TaxID=1286148 RepID=A0A2T6K9X1_9RHOB|nr:YjbH domain-containing protein [Yoonia sediminilitoris]PUB11597.1 exopolysaccharide biosynthesis protein YbjH [Yoonia sediminilitoris]RCW91797.1 exopolysaccharide biosynthesis protein YbjH [Yoonia sediminilitoris]